MTPFRYLTLYLGSLQFWMSYMFPLRYQRREVPPLDGLPLEQQVGYLLDETVINLRQFSDGERADLYRLAREDVGRHLGQSLADAKVWERGAEKIIDMAIGHESLEKIVEVARDMMKGRTQ